MTWQLYLLISILLISFNGLLNRSLMKNEKSHAQAAVIASTGVAGIIALLFAFVHAKISLFIPISLLLPLGLFVFLVTPGYILSRKALKMIGASEIIVLLATGRLWNVFGAYFFLHEHVTVLHIIGAIIIIIGVFITRFEKRQFVINKGVMLALVAAFFLGMSDVAGYYILNFTSATNFLVYSYFLPLLAIVTLQPNSVKKLGYFLQIDKSIKLILLSICDACGMLALYSSYQVGGQASVIGPLSATRVLLTAGLAMLLLHERNNIQNKLIGAIVTVLGVILLL